eukprot:2431729-Prymnesium_polylepis.1
MDQLAIPHISDTPAASTAPPRGTWGRGTSRADRRPPSRRLLPASRLPFASACRRTIGTRRGGRKE